MKSRRRIRDHANLGRNAGQLDQETTAAETGIRGNCVATTPGRTCPLWVNLCRLRISAARLLYPRNRTSLGAVGTAEKCQEATFAQSSRRCHPSRQVSAPRPGAARKSLLGLLQRGVQRCAVPPARCERGTAPRPAAVHRECPGVHLQSNWTLREALALGFQRFDQAEVFEDGGMEAIRKACMSSLNGASG